MDLHEIILKFKNGEERYHTDSLMRQCAIVLSKGQDPVIIIDQLIETINNQTESLIKFYNLHPMPNVNYERHEIEIIDNQIKIKE